MNDVLIETLSSFQPGDSFRLLSSCRRALLQALAAGFECLAPHSIVRAAPPSGLQTWGYYPLWMNDSWKRMNLAIWNRLLLFELPVHPNSGVNMRARWHEKWHALASRARQCGARLDIAFTLLGDAKFDHLFSRPTLRNRLLADMMHNADAAAADGIHLDIEAFGRVSQPAVAGLRKFIADLCRQSRRQDSRRTISVFFPIGTERELFDAESLGYPDYVVLQGYDAHWIDSRTAGPLSPLKKRTAIVGKEPAAFAQARRAARENPVFDPLLRL